jgi:hypothetical protein
VRRLAILMAAAVAVAGLGACGGGQRVAYRPTAFGEFDHCYFINSPAEAIALQAAGLCQPGWSPLMAPAYWHARYAPFYSSPSYVRVYVPASERDTFTRSERTWAGANRGVIAAEAKKATYLGSNGKRVSAEKIGATKFGGGNRFGAPGTKFGGGSRGADPAKAKPKADTKPKAPTVKAPTVKPKAPTAKTPTVEAPTVRSPTVRSPSGGRSGGGSGGFRSSGGGSRR